MRHVAYGLLLMLPLAALADTWGVSSVGSYHFNRSEEHCERNPGIGFEYGGKLRAVGGIYRNSDCKTSVYAGTSYAPWRSGSWRVGGMLILVTGYEKHALLAPGGILAYEGRRYGLNIILLPSAKGDITQGALGLQVKFRW